MCMCVHVLLVRMCVHVLLVRMCVHACVCVCVCHGTLVVPPIGTLDMMYVCLFVMV